MAESDNKNTTKVVTIGDDLQFSLNKLSRAFGVARETVKSRLEDYGVKAAGDRSGHPVYELKAAAKAILQVNLPNISFDNPDLMLPKDRKDWYASENDRIKLEEKLGQLVAIDDSRQQMVNIVDIFLPVFETLSDELERDFDFPPEVIVRVEERMDAIRNQIAEMLEAEEE